MRIPSARRSFEARKGAHLRSYGSAGGQEVRIGVATTIQPRRTKMTSLDHTDAPATVDYATVYVAFELSKAKWMLGVILPGSKKLGRYTIAGGDGAALAPGRLRGRKQAGGRAERASAC